MRLLEALEQSSTAALRRMASVHGLRHDEGTTRDELIARLVERLLDTSYLHDHLAGLTTDELATLAAARAGGGELRGRLVERDYPGAAEALSEHGLLFRIFSAAGPLRGEVFVAADELLALFPPPPPAEPLPSGAPEPPPPERRVSDPAFSLFCIASALSRPGAQLEQDVRAWAAEPGGWDWEARWALLRHLGEAAGLFIHRADGTLTHAPNLAVLLNDPARLAERLWKTYVSDRAWSDLAHAGVVEGAEFAERLPLRRALMGVIEELPADSWFDLATWSAWLQRTRPKLVREQLNARGLVVLELADWSSVETRLLRYVLLGPMYWLGAISSNVDGRLVARRATVGARARQMNEPCTWEGAAELIAPPRAALGTLLEAERYLVLHERGRPSRYHLVQSHVAAALGGGGSVGEGRRLLSELTQGGLPTVVAERLSAWEERFGALAIRPAVLVEARTRSDLDDAVAGERVRSFVRERLSPTMAEVAAADALELAAELRASGHLPRVDAALRLSSEPRRAYASLVDEQVLEFLLVSLLAFRVAWPERLAELEGSQSLLERLEHQFPPERLVELRTVAARLAGQLQAAPSPRRSRARPQRTRRKKSSAAQL